MSVRWNARKCSRKKVAFELEPEIPVKVQNKGGSEWSFVSVNLPIGGRWQSPKGIIPGQFTAKGQFPNVCMGERNHSNLGESIKAALLPTIGWKKCAITKIQQEVVRFGWPPGKEQ